MSENNVSWNAGGRVLDDDRAYQAARAETSFINRVYLWMCAGLAATGGIAWWIGTNEALVKKLVSSQGLFLGLILLELGLVFFLSLAINKINAVTAAICFFLYAAVNGVTLSVIFLAYTQSSIATTFMVTSGTFGVVSLYGMLTKRNLATLGGFFSMLLIGFLIGTVVNIFWANSTFYWILTYLGIAVFVGLTAYDTQKIKMMAGAAGEGAFDEESGKKAAVMGALTIYLDFINLFLLLLRIFGGSRKN
ncbi:MAG: Bax inhibitor-1/YccA family protein [Victivallaceae bacterium]|nr:Bax inhibitor-1/YccA family protein [Victivallaceae bacterium]